MALYDYLRENYDEDTPIFMSDCSFGNVSDTAIRQQMKKLTDSGKLKRFASGIYFLPGNSPFISGSTLSFRDVVKQKYLQENGKVCGYVTGLAFANLLGITTQLPAVTELCTNKASTAFRRVSFAGQRLILRKPRTTVTEENYRQLQLLDMFCEADSVAEFSDAEVSVRLRSYMDAAGLVFSVLAPYFSLYPDKLFRNFYRYGVLYNVSA